MFPKNRRKFSRFVNFFHKLGIIVGILSFTFDRLGNRVKRSRTLECYSFLLISSWVILRIIIHIKLFVTVTDFLLGVVASLQLFFFVLNWIVLLITLTSNRQKIVDLVNDGLKIEQDFRNHYYSKSWNHNMVLAIFLKDIIYAAGYTYFNISARRNDGIFFYYYRIVSATILCFSIGFTENLKIICSFHVSHLLGVLNKSLSRKRTTINIESIQEISKMYERLLVFADKISKISKFRTTMVLINSLIITSTEVYNKLETNLPQNFNLNKFQFFWLYADVTLKKFTIHSLVLTVTISQFCILQVYLLAKSQASISRELSKTVQVLHSFNYKLSRETNIELEKLMLKVLHNSNGRNSRMFPLDYPFIYGVSCQLKTK